MAMKTIVASDALSAFEAIEELLSNGDDGIIFRGHGCDQWRLQSTLHRFVRGGNVELSIKDMDGMLHHFLARLASVGKLPDKEMNRRTKLEFARHYGLPSPLIDFSHSPYVALWMALNGKRPWDNGKAAVYALRLAGLGTLWQKYTRTDHAFDQFRWSERELLFKGGYPLNTLQFIEFPASWNTRMLRQLGVFLYDTLDYKGAVEFIDLEDFIEKSADPQGADEAPTFTLQKLVIPYSASSKIFERLELMGIDGTRLYDGHEGAIADVVNAYVFNRKTGYVHDLSLRE